MLKVRIIPTLLWNDFGLVKGISFDSWRRVGTILPAIKVYNMREVDELIVLDICATRDKRQPDTLSVSEFAQECFCPLTIGGGINSIVHVKQLLRAGADKVCVNSAAFDKPELISEIAYKFGTQCVVVSIDARKTGTGTYECYSHNGSRPTGRGVEEWARQVEEMGAGEIMICSIEQDGTMQGYNLELIKMIADAVSIPVIASGGAGQYQDFLDVIRNANVSAVAAASIYHFTEKTPLEAKMYLAQHGIAVRKFSIC